MARHHYRLRVPFADVDHAGIVYYPRLFHYFHLAYESWFQDALQHPFAELFTSQGFITPVVRAEGTFRTPLHHGDEVEVETWISAARKRSWTFRFRLHHGDTLCAEGSVTHAFVAPPRMNAVELPPDWRERIAPWVEED